MVGATREGRRPSASVAGARLADELLVGQLLGAQVEVNEVADGLEARGHLHTLRQKLLQRLRHARRSRSRQRTERASRRLQRAVSVHLRRREVVVRELDVALAQLAAHLLDRLAQRGWQHLWLLDRLDAEHIVEQDHTTARIGLVGLHALHAAVAQHMPTRRAAKRP
eukprot:5479629-Prymnesium_polylepis.1